MNIDYNYIRTMCIEWYINESKTHAHSILDNIVDSELTKYNYFGDKNKRSKFRECDLTTIKKGEYSTKEYIHFIIAKSFKPRTNFMKMFNIGSWNYTGYILKIESNDIRYINTMPLTPQKLLKKFKS